MTGAECDIYDCLVVVLSDVAEFLRSLFRCLVEVSDG